MASSLAAKTSFFRKKWFLVTCGLALFYTLAGFFLVPRVLKSQMESKLPPVLHRAVTVQDVQFNPYVLSLKITGFQITEPDGKPFASLDEFFVNLQLSSLFQRSLNFKEISLKKPTFAIVLHEGGKTNFDDLLSGGSQPAPSTEPSTPPKINIAKLEISGGSISFDDLTRASNFQTRVDPIQLSLTDFSTNPDANSPYSFSAHTETGATLSWSGAFSVNPLRSNGVLTLGGVQIKHFAPYLADFTRAHVADGEAGLRAEYRLDTSGGPIDLQINHATFELTKLTLKSPDTQEPVVTLASFAVREVNADVLKHTVTVDVVDLTDGAILAKRQRDGTLNLQTLVKPRTDQAPPSTASTTDAVKQADGPDKKDPWRLAVKEIKLTNLSVTAEDAVPSTPAKLMLDRINLKLDGVAFPDRTPIAAEASLRWDRSGMITASGTIRHSSVFADLQITVAEFDLRPFQPYLDELVNLQLMSGTLNLQGHVVHGASEPGAPRVRFTGRFSLDQMAVADTVSSKSLVAWEKLGLTGIHADVDPTSVAIDEIRLRKLKSALVVGQDGRMNVSNVVRTSSGKPEQAKEHPKPESGKTAQTPISVKAVVIEDSAVSFTDRSIQPPYAAEIRKLAGRIEGLSSKDTSKAKVELTGKFDAHAPLQISGRINPLSKDLFVDLAFSLKSFDLPPLSSYTGKFAGYPLQKGKLFADLKFKVAERKLDAENVVLVDQLTLGPHTDSPDATKLPVKLALAILQDRQGKINLDVPVSGNLDDPEFRLGKVIWRAFLNILEKVATSPFALIGAIAGGGGEELSVINFAPGSATPLDTEGQKLDKLIKVLTERPGLTLEITGLADPDKDRLALAKDKLRRSFKQRRMKDVRGAKPTSLDEVPLDDAEYERMVRTVYAEIPKAARQPSTSSSALAPDSTTALLEAEPKPEKKSGFWDFFSRLNPFKSGRSAKKESSQTSAGAPDSTGTPSDQAIRSGPTFAEMERALIEKQDVTADDLNLLSQSRAKTVQSSLSKGGELSDERLFIVSPESEEGKPAGESKVTLSLK